MTVSKFRYARDGNAVFRFRTTGARDAWVKLRPGRAAMPGNDVSQRLKTRGFDLDAGLTLRDGPEPRDDGPAPRAP